MLKLLPDKLFAKLDGEDLIYTAEVDVFDDGDEIGVYKLMSTKRVHKKVTLSPTITNNGAKPKEKK